MKLLLDTANVGLIEKYNDIYDIAGVTSNPTILAREGGAFRAQLLAIREIIGSKELHVQVVANTYEDMLHEAEFILKKFGAESYVKVPVNEVGIQLMKNLKLSGYNVTATAVYTVEQAILAASIGADYIAPYFNRMVKLGMDAAQNIRNIKSIYQQHNLKTQILAASFQSIEQITEAILAGADAVTASPELYTAMLSNPHVDEAIEKFAKDWQSAYGYHKIFEL